MDQQTGTPSGQYQGQHQPTMAPQQPGMASQQPYYDSSPGPSSEPAGSESRSPLNTLGLSFLHPFRDRKTKDGAPAKKRGPKPDAKPAASRRQELNRQAQRTHRQRKEYYIKSLEQEVMQLREVYTGTVQEKNAMVKENEQLKELLRMHGISFESIGAIPGPGNLSLVPPVPGPSSEAGYGMSASSASPQARFPTASASPDMFSGGQFGSGPSPHAPQLPPPQQQRQQPSSQQQQGQGEMDFDQLGVDFVLASVSHSPAHAGMSAPDYSPYNLRHPPHGR